MRGLVTMAVAVGLCCGVAWLLVAGGLLGAAGGLASSPELTVAAAGVTGWALVRWMRRIRRSRRQQVRRQQVRR